ncbi:MAG: RHS repeat-associated core domain-containing protein [Candidatus Omnitrophota bacterium]|nr:RHS repeat-associated core domain-containing protein [Candidatus Omnitrophota bacterium]
MKKISAFFISLGLILSVVSLVFAQNADVSGEWWIDPTVYPIISAKRVQTDIIHLPTGDKTGITESTVAASFAASSGFYDVTQNSNGDISASRSITDAGGTVIISTMKGKVTGNTVTFTIDNKMIFPSDAITGFSGYEATNLACSGTIKTSDLPNTIDYTYSGTYYLYSQMSTPWADSFTVTTATSENTASLRITKSSPPPPQQPNPPPDSSNGEFYSDPQNSVGEPINSVTGNMYIITPDLTLSGKGMNFAFSRTYNSQSASNTSESGPLGYGWTHSYNLYLTQDTQNKLVKIKDEEGKGYLFADNQDGTFVSQRGEYSILTKDSSNFIWRKKDGKQYIFDLAGKLTQIKDRNNNTINLSYNNQNQLTSVTDTYGRKIELTYSEARISSLIDPSSRSFIYTYDTQGNLSAATDPLGNSTTYTYDSQHNLTKQTDPLNQSIYYTYDSLNRCTSSSGENNAGRVDLVFDPANHQTTITDSKNNSAIHYYNDDSLIIKVKNTQGSESTSIWDNNFNLVSRTDALGRATQMEYDAKGNLTKVTDADNKITSFTYEPDFNLLLTSTDAQSNLTTYTRDASGNPTKVTDAYNNSTNYTYNNAGQVTSVQNALGNSTNFTYDTQGNLIQVKDALGNLTTFSYDTIGNLLQSKDALSNITKFTYDNLNQLTKVTYPDDTTLTYVYDSAGNRISVTDTLGNTTTSTFDQFQRITSTTDALGNSINYVYDSEGNLTSLTDQNNNQTTYTYDSLNRLILETDALGNKKQYQYDAVGNRTTYIDAKNQSTSYTYDKLNRLTKITYPDRDVSYTYDSLGRRLTMLDERGTTNYTYDKLGRLTQVDGPKANDTVSYTYDKLGNRLTMTDPTNKITSYSYDALNRLTSITDPQAKVTSYTYDTLGNLTNLIYPNATKTTYTYDTLNRLLKLTEQLATSPYTKLAEFSYTYDQLGRRTQVNLLDASQINYTYDALSQLTQENKTYSTSPYQISYSYDPAGNRLEMINQGVKHAYSYNSLNQLTEESFSGGSNPTKITVTGRASDASGIKQVTVNNITAALAGNSFTCADVTLTPGPNTLTVIATDQAGNSTTKILHVTYSPTTKLIYTYDNNGSLISKTGSGDALNLSYDSTNRLTRFKNSQLDETYQYDAEGKRIAKQSGSSTTNYLYDGLNVIQENTSIGSTNYTRNPNAPGGIGGIINQQSPSNVSSYYHYDGLGSVTNLTNSTGTNTQTYSYDAFGNLQGLSSKGTVPDLRGFLTKEADSTGLSYFGARYYDPKIGRFITQDPSGMSDGPNLYLYVKNNPVNFVDAWGLCKNPSQLILQQLSPSDIIFGVKQYLKVLDLLSPQLRATLDTISSFSSNKGPLETLGGIGGGLLGGIGGSAIGSVEGPFGTFVIGTIGSYLGSKFVSDKGKVADEYYYQIIYELITRKENK